MAFKRAGGRFPSPPPGPVQSGTCWSVFHTASVCPERLLVAGHETSIGSRSTVPGGRAGIAQLVEHNLAKVGVAGSSPVSRSGCANGGAKAPPFSLVYGQRAGMAKLADARDLKSRVRKDVRVRDPV